MHKFRPLNLIVLLLLIAFLFMAHKQAEAACLADEASANVTIQKAEDWLVDYINRLRTEPEEALAELGIDGNITLLEHEELVCNWFGCYKQVFKTFPLARSEMLDKLAKLWAEDMAARNYFSYVSPEGRTINDLLEDEGYPSSNGTQIISAILIRDFQDPCRAVNTMVKNLVEKALIETEISADLAELLNARYNSIGVALTPAVFTMPDGSYSGTYLLVIILDRPVDMFMSKFVQCGHLYKDYNSDGIYEVGEGLSGLEFYDVEAQPIGSSYSEGMFCIERFENGWTWNIGDRYLEDSEMYGMSFWVDGEYRQDLEYDLMLQK